MAVRIKQRALSDLDAIRDWSEDRWGLDQANRFLSGLVDAIERLSEFPLLGRPSFAISPGLRALIHKGFVIYYVIEKGGPVIVTVQSTRRDLSGATIASWIDQP